MHANIFSPPNQVKKEFRMGSLALDDRRITVKRRSCCSGSVLIIGAESGIDDPVSSTNALGKSTNSSVLIG